ncbi:tRNA uridine-5-carboxymethylaminomethyl(34) synthesis GTPase MnmE [Suttonella sp. R2A3]|uniref:tRNA uridine-5-carboxymethylaminomethyl(34) synthesis GTPase MnmE n=1 Tax=Suttonella sp. R2A3 TaxID=2908648 RepID=UPI001F35C2D6|nr:tRNA uridine-5-carboxymethylaminomethyl(34) synthesis GTPase MnmE [Suttonella sp. R2A3]UJF24691.1 tRNA uridine-5-carboxymethylaminomethyl(34) synthesis GTPase MnmE [Suttonella sp. R2A3]
MTNEDTIVALATPPGQGGVAVLRLSGTEALAIAKAITGKTPEPRYAVFSNFQAADGAVIDQGLVLYFRAPHSFTGEDVVELQGHGGVAVTQSLLQECINAGARLAEAGEFSKRAFLNDKIDLAQAEAIADLVSARSQAAARAASQSLQGVFSQKVEALAEELLALRVYIEAALDFPEEEIDFLTEGDIEGRLKTWGAQLEELIGQTSQGCLLNEGVNMVLLGKPNAGKSSLLNALVGEERAIVTEHAGTTRDIVRETVVIEGIPVNILDTAGLRESDDAIEQEGIRRSHQAMAQADIVVWISDATALDEAAREQALADKPAHIPVLDVYNKMDLLDGAQQSEHTERLYLAAKTGDGLNDFTRRVAQLVGKNQREETLFIARERHVRALQRTQEYYQHAYAQTRGARLAELIAEDLRLAHDALGEITGTVSADDLLGVIFSSFCIGK